MLKQQRSVQKLVSSNNDVHLVFETATQRATAMDFGNERAQNQTPQKFLGNPYICSRMNMSMSKTKQAGFGNNILFSQTRKSLL